jgi:spermidine synthase
VKPWEILGRARAPDGTELTLTRHVSEVIISAGGQTLMSSRAHASEDALGVLGCERARTLAEPSVLIGGLGMGFTLRAALDVLPPGASVQVMELVPAVVEWNRGPLGELAGRPLDDARVRLEDGDVALALRASPGAFDAVLLDVDNGPAALTSASNAGLYDRQGVAAARASLRPGGVLAVWSARDDRGFERRLRAAGLNVRRARVRGHSKRGGHRQTILIAE